MTFVFFSANIHEGGEDRLSTTSLFSLAAASRYKFEDIADVDFPQAFDCPLPVDVPPNQNMLLMTSYPGLRAFYFLEYIQGMTYYWGQTRFCRAVMDVFSTYDVYSLPLRGVWHRGHVCGYSNGANPPKPRTVTAQSGDVKFPYPSSDATVQKMSTLMGYEDTYRLVIFATAGDTNPGAIETYADGEKICLYSEKVYSATGVTDVVGKLATTVELYNLAGLLRTAISTLDSIYAIPTWMIATPSGDTGFFPYQVRDADRNVLISAFSKLGSSATLVGNKATVDSMNDQALVCGTARIEIPSVCVSGESAEYGIRFTSAITPTNIALSMAYGSQSADITQYFKVPFYWRDEGAKQERDIQAVLGAGLGLLGLVSAGAGGLGAAIGATGIIAGAAQSAGAPAPTYFGAGSYPGSWLTYPSEYSANTVFGGPVMITYRRTLASQYMINAYGGVGDVAAQLTLSAAMSATGYNPKWIYAQGDVELPVSEATINVPEWAREEISALMRRGVRAWCISNVDTTADWWSSRYQA